MWEVSCYENSKDHVELRARQRILFYSRAIYNMKLTEEEVKEKILDIMRKSLNKDYLEIDEETSLPKYKLRDFLPDTKIGVCLYVLEDEKNKKRKIKTLISDWEQKFPKF